MAKDMEAVINAAIDNATEEGTIPDAEGSETDSTVVEETHEESTEQSTEATTKVDATKTEEAVDALMDEFVKDGVKLQKGNKNNRIPYDNVKKILGNRESKAVEAVAKAIGVDAKTLKFDGLEAAISEKMKTYTDLESQSENYARAEEVMMTDPDRYIRILATIEPEKYGKFLKALGEEGKTKEEPKEEEFEVDLDEPDLDLGDGRSTYSPEGLKKAIAGAVKQAIQHGEKIATAKAEGAVKPFKDRQAQEEDNRRREQLTNAELDASMKWRGMDVHFDKVLDALKADTKQATIRGKVDHSKLKYRNIRDAYIDTVPALLADEAAVSEQKVREKILAEMKKTTTSTAVATDTTRKANKSDDGSEDKITAAIERSLAKAGL